MSCIGCSYDIVFYRLWYFWFALFWVGFVLFAFCIGCFKKYKNLKHAQVIQSPGSQPCSNYNSNYGQVRRPPQRGPARLITLNTQMPNQRAPQVVPQPPPSYSSAIAATPTSALPPGYNSVIDGSQPSSCPPPPPPMMEYNEAPPAYTQQGSYPNTQKDASMGYAEPRLPGY